MAKTEISIIVPIFNVGRYLRMCLDSIRAQSFKDWECILVDDGSTDGSPSICDEYVAIDSRFKVIHKPNGGVSSARNAGLRAASGEFIGFVDPDDWIEPEMYQLLYDRITEYQADIAQIGFIKEFIGRRSTKHLTNKTKVISREEAVLEIGFDRMPNYLWNKLHRRSIVNGEFPEGQTFEDIYVYGKWLKNVRTMVLDPSPVYHYRMRKGSIIHTDASKNRYDYFHSCIFHMEMIESINGHNDIDRKNAYINKTAVYAAKIIARLEKDKGKRDSTIHTMSEEVKAFPLPSVRHMGLKAWWRSKLLRNNPDLFCRVMKGVSTFDLDRKDRERRYYD